jgi:2-succinyl-5-enolpyruvyl-6-hydroxy-3-cyclohexene-1-carboxylate synthase
VEASESFVPVIAVTADRPFELLDCGAPQTIDQTRLFGQFARAFVDVGMPDAHPEALLALRRKVAQAVHKSRHPLPGPVHLNVHARKPLEPVLPSELEGPTADEESLRARVTMLLAEPPLTAQAPEARLPKSALATLLDRIERAERGLIVVGRREPFEAPAQAEAFLRLAEITGLPLLAEAPSQLRLDTRSSEAVFVDAIEGVVRAKLRSSAPPDLVLELGPPLTSGAFAELAARLPRNTRVAVQRHGWADPQNSLAELYGADPAAVALELVTELERRPRVQSEARRAFRQELQEANRAAWNASDELLSQPSASLLEPVAVRQVVESLPNDALLAVGNSLAIRELDWVAKRGMANATVWVQRGANGIDGLIAGASGAALASRRPTCLLLGDVSALHDLGSLHTARLVKTPFLVVVVDNGGGHIFNMLPFAAQAAHRPEVWRYWSTPPEIDLRAAAATFGARYAEAASTAEISRVVKAALSEPGLALLRLVVEPGSAERFARQLPERIVARQAP